MFVLVEEQWCTFTHNHTHPHNMNMNCEGRSPAGCSRTQFKWIMWTDTAMTTLNLIVAGTKHPNGQIVQILLLFLCDVYLIFVIIESYRDDINGTYVLSARNKTTSLWMCVGVYVCVCVEKLKTISLLFVREIYASIYCLVDCNPACFCLYLAFNSGMATKNNIM